MTFDSLGFDHRHGTRKRSTALGTIDLGTIATRTMTSRTNEANEREKNRVIERRGDVRGSRSEASIALGRPVDEGCRCARMMMTMMMMMTGER